MTAPTRRTVVAALAGAAVGPVGARSGASGGRIETLEVPAPPGGGAAPVQVWLPPGYEAEPARRHPVLYLLDGQNMFEGEGAGPGSPVRWRMEHAAARLVEAGAIEPPLLVAVAHRGALRLDDYAPWPIQRQGRTLGGGAAAHARWLHEVLKPTVDRRYRTRPERAHTSVGGSSVAALLVLWLLVHHGEAFGGGLAVSPSVWWADRAIVGELARAPQPPVRLWVDIGLHEPGEAVADARRLRDAVQALGWPLRYVEDPDGRHDEAAWSRRAEAMLRHLVALPGAPRS